MRSNHPGGRVEIGPIADVRGGQRRFIANVAKFRGQSDEAVRGARQDKEHRHSSYVRLSEPSGAGARPVPHSRHFAANVHAVTTLGIDYGQEPAGNIGCTGRELPI
jgi:hypothetical protein